MSEPKRLIVEYEDGSTKAVDMGNVDYQCRSALVRLGICPPENRVAASKHYLVLQWDGWQEVLGIDKGNLELLRYYVIRRIDDLGRLSLESDGEMPELFSIKRMPRELKSVVVAGSTDMRVYDLSKETERWEGIFEAGGKMEYVKYDKTDRSRQDGKSGNSEKADSFRMSLKNELTQRGMTAGQLLAQEESKRTEAYGQIARAMGLHGCERQSDVYGFIELLLRQLTA